MYRLFFVMYKCCFVCFVCLFFCFFFVFFFFKQKTAYEVGGRDWSSDVCSSDLVTADVISAGTGWGWRRGGLGRGFAVGGK